MKTFGKCLLVLILVGWLPATNACALASAYPQIFSDCCSGDGPNSDDDGCCAKCTPLEKTLTTSATRSPAPLSLFVAVERWTEKHFALAIDAEELPVIRFVSGPPELLKTWQFSVRAALAPRAPSLAS